MWGGSARGSVHATAALLSRAQWGRELGGTQGGGLARRWGGVQGRWPQGVPRVGGQFGGRAGTTCRSQGLEEVYGHPGPGDSNSEPRTALCRENPRRGWVWGDARVPEPPLHTGASNG